MKEIAQAILHGAVVITTGGFSESLRLVYPKAKTVDAHLFNGQILMYGEQFYVVDKRFADRVDMNTYDNASFCRFNQDEEGLILKHLKELVG